MTTTEPVRPKRRPLFRLSHFLRWAENLPTHFADDDTLPLDGRPTVADVPNTLWAVDPRRIGLGIQVSDLVSHAVTDPTRSVYIIGDPLLARDWSEVFTERKDRAVRRGQYVASDDIVVWLPGWSSDDAAHRDADTLRRNLAGSDETPIHVIAEW